MTVLVTGGGGQLGWDVCRALERRGVPYAAPSHGEMDLTQRDQVAETVRRVRPDAVIHCGAWTNVEAAEDAREEVFAVNEGGHTECRPGLPGDGGENALYLHGLCVSRDGHRALWAG